MLEYAKLILAVDSTSATKATDALENLSRSGAKAERAAATVTKGFREGELSAKAYGAALRQLPAQLTDITTGLLSGQSPFIVLIQQGGQLKDSFGGIGAAARAVAGALGPLGAGLLGVGASVAALATLMLRAEHEQSAFNRALALTGHYAGVTADDLGEMSRRLDEIGTSRNRASDVLTQLVSTAAVGSQQIERFAKAAIDAETYLGQSTEDVAKHLAELGRDPVQATLRLNQSMHYLTASTLEQLNALVATNRTTEAARVAQEAYIRALGTGSREAQSHLGTIEAGWIAIKKAIDEASDASLNFDARPARARSATEGALLAADKQRVSGLTVERTDGTIGILTAAEAHAKLVRGIAEEALQAEQRLDLAREASLTTQERLNRALQQYREDFAALAADGHPVSLQEQDKILQHVRDSFQGAGRAARVMASDIEEVSLSIRAANEYTSLLAPLVNEAGRVFEATRTPLEKYNAQLERLKTLHQTIGADGAPLIDDDTLVRGIKQAGDAYATATAQVNEFASATKEATNTASVYAEEAARRIEHAFADFLFDPFKDGLKGMLLDFEDTLRRLVAEAAAAQILDGLFGTTATGAPDIFGGFGRLVGAAGSFFGSIFGGGSSGGATGLPTTPAQLGGLGASALGGYIPANQPRWVGERGPEWFTPGAPGTVMPAGSEGKSVVVNMPITIMAPNGQVSKESVTQAQTRIFQAARLAYARNS